MKTRIQLLDQADTVEQIEQLLTSTVPKLEEALEARGQSVLPRPTPPTVTGSDGAESVDIVWHLELLQAHAARLQTTLSLTPAKAAEARQRVLAAHPGLREQLATTPAKPATTTPPTAPAAKAKPQTLTQKCIAAREARLAKQ